MTDELKAVAVAEALGWTDCHEHGGLLIESAPHWRGRPPGWVPIVGHPEEGWEKVPRFDCDWAAAGPLVEELGIMVHADDREAAHKDVRAKYDTPWFHESEVEGPAWFRGETVLIAVCDLVLAMRAAGKLPAGTGARVLTRVPVREA